MHCSHWYNAWLGTVNSTGQCCWSYRSDRCGHNFNLFSPEITITRSLFSFLQSSACLKCPLLPLAGIASSALGVHNKYRPWHTKLQQPREGGGDAHHRPSITFIHLVFLFTLFRCKCKSWDSIALECGPVASKLKIGQLKIRNKSKYIETGLYCLERNTVLVQGLHT